MNPFVHRDPAKRARIKKIACVCVCVGIALLLALFEFFFPLKTLLPAYSILPREEGEMRVHFLDVGEGDCTVIEFPDGDALVVDAGDGAFEHENQIIRYLKGLNITSYSLLVTHADIDHYGGFVELIHTFQADTLYTPITESEDSAYLRFLSEAEKSGLEFVPVKRYSVIARPSGAYAVCISPTSAGEADENDGSTVLFVSYGGVNLLLGGDISSRQEERLLREYALLEGIFDSREYPVRLEETHILKVSHHGSAYSSSEEWLSLLSPETAFISCGRGNQYSHPAQESVARLAAAGTEVYRTDELGNIAISIKDGNYTILE